MEKNDKKVIFYLVIFFIAVVFLLNPIGNFPLNDDWVYAHPINELLFQHKIDFYYWTGPILIFQVFYGFLITIITGFSFTVLRLTTLLFSFLSLLIVYFLTKKTSKEKGVNILLILTLFLNPLFINTSFTFMTDVPFLFFYLLAIYGVYKSVEQKKYKWLMLGLTAAIASFFIRQIGLLFFGALGFFYLLSWFNKSIDKKYLKKSLLGLIISLGVCFSGYLIFKNNINIGGAQTHLLEDGLIKHVIKWLFYGAQYLGLFALPVTCLWLFKKENYKKKNIIIFIILFLFLIATTFIFKQYFPYNQNIINDYGLGPTTEVLQGTPPLILNGALKLFLSLVACFGGALLITILIIKSKKLLKDNLLTFVFLNFVFQLIFILIFIGFDRYFLVLLPLCLIMVLPEAINNKFALSVVVLITFAFFSLTLERNYLDWNRIRNKLYNNLIQTEFLQHVEGGYELNGWYTYKIMKNFPKKIEPLKPWYLCWLFPQNTNKYVISFSVLPGYQVIKSEKYYNYFLFKNINLYVIKK